MCLVVLIFIVLGIGFTFVLGALNVAIVSAMFLDTPFADGWDAAWDHPWRLLIFAIFILPSVRGSRS